MSLIKSKLRKIARFLFLNIVGSYKRPSRYVHILNGHMVDWLHDNDSDGFRFAKLLSKLHEYCDFVNFQDAVKMIENHEKVSKPTVAFSFDDGWRDCYTQIAPQLEMYGINAAFFINPNFVNAYENRNYEYINHFTNNVTESPGKVSMTWKQIKELKDRGFIIGGHSLDHCRIDINNEDELEYQIGHCKKIMEMQLGTPCDYFALPYGNLKAVNPIAVNIACKHYMYVFSQCNYKKYYSCDNRILNRRHFEPFWPVKHVLYFLSTKRN